MGKETLRVNRREGREHTKVAAENWSGHDAKGEKETFVQALANSSTAQMFVITSLIVLSPPFCAAASFVTNKLPNSSLAEISKFGAVEFFYEAFASGGWVGSAAAVKIVGAMFGAGLLFYYVPAKEYSCSVTPTGHVPKYLDNGLHHLYGTTLLFFGGVVLGFWEGSVLFDHAHETVLFCNAFGLVFCAFLYFKGLYAPSCTESGSLGKGFINDYWHGTDQYPRLFGIDVKLMINCRFSMMYWFLMSISCIFASYKYNNYLDPAVLYCGALQAIYLWKFFKWESGYMNSIDIIVDRGGFMILWGCLTFVPAMYTLCTRVLVHTPGQFSWFSATIIFCIGLAGVGLNYAVDWERQYFRQTGGKQKIWGSLPTKLDVTYFVTEGDKQVEKTSTLLTSGFWGFSRHTNYIFELQLAYAWCFLACSENYIALFYPIFLTCLLFHRSVRDELKCMKKYGDGYRKYMDLVRYRVIPFIF